MLKTIFISVALIACLKQSSFLIGEESSGEAYKKQNVSFTTLKTTCSKVITSLHKLVFIQHSESSNKNIKSQKKKDDQFKSSPTNLFFKPYSFLNYVLLKPFNYQSPFTKVLLSPPEA